MQQNLTRTKTWLAERLGLRRLFAASTYTLIKQLQADAPPEGPEGNERLQALFLELAGILQPNLFMDIGANDGSASLAVRRRLPHCTIHAFEANPRIFARNRERLEAEGVRFWNLAVSDKPGRVTIYAPLTLSQAYVDGEVVPAHVEEAEDTGKSSLLRRNENATYSEFDVEAATLDGFAQAHVPDWGQRTAFLWVDVEGASDRVLAGATQLLARTRAIFLETEGFPFWEGQASTATVLNRLMRAGFLPIARDREYGDKQFNILLLHQDVVEQVIPVLLGQGGARKAPPPPAPAPAPSAPAPVPAPAPATPHLSLACRLQGDVPVIIPCFDTVTYVRGMVEQLRGRGLRNIILVDNASTYAPMRAYLQDPGAGVTVIAQAENKGPRDCFTDPATLALLPQVFCVTDPDLSLNPDMPPDFIGQLAALTERHAAGKAGLALDISTPALMRDEEFRIGGRGWKIWEWEAQFWQEGLEPTAGGDPVFKAQTDTTFAVYNKRHFDPHRPLDGVRVGGRFTCRHLPWYRENGLPAEEERHYRQHARDSFYLRNSDSPPPRLS